MYSNKGLLSGAHFCRGLGGGGGGDGIIIWKIEFKNWMGLTLKQLKVHITYFFFISSEYTNQAMMFPE